MALALVSHVAPTPDRLHLWVGVSDVTSTPALAWKMNDRPVVPTTLRALTPVLDGALAVRAETAVYTGFFEIGNLAQAASVKIEVSAGTARLERHLQTLPAQVPQDVQDRFNVLLLSCFHRLEDKTGLAG